MLLNARQIREFTHGHFVVPCDEEKPVTGITWDSRAVAPGNLYVALPGERVDGHDFIVSALKAGATAALIMHEVDEETRACVQTAGAALILVDDCAGAIADLARGWRGCLQGKVIVVTGSSGKTTTKNLVRDVLSQALTVVATEANQNNELGVPCTVLNADADTEAVVVEIGMRGRGQIASLCSVVRPDFGIITNVGTSHIELLGSRENIARAKAELVEALPHGGTAILNAADDYTDFICRETDAAARGVNVVRYDGSDTVSDAVVRATDIVLDGEGRPAFVLRLPTGCAPCSLTLRGLHNVSNACAAAAAAYALGMDAAAIASALSKAEAMTGRQDICRSAAGVTIVDDSYNANPDSMRASLAMFAALDVPGRRIAVLGDMGELGSYAQTGHEQVGALVAAAHLDRLVCVGELSRMTARAACTAGMDAARVVEADSVGQALEALAGTLQTGDAVLVKASHSMGLENVVKGLMA